MKFKNNKGYVGIDASMSLIILLIIVPTLVGMIYNVNKTNNLIDRKTQAISIAVNTIETAKGIEIADLTSEEVITELKQIYPAIDETDSTLTIDDKDTYKIEVEIKDYADTEEAEQRETETGIEIQSGKVKIVKVIVTFKSGKDIEKIELTTVTK